MTVFVDRARLHAPAERWLVVAERVSGAIQEGWGSQTAFVAASGLSDATIRKLQGGKQASFRTKTLDQVEDALGWPRGAIRELLEGAPDIPHEAFSDGEPSPDYGDIDPRDRAVRERTQDLTRVDHIHQAFDGTSEQEAEELFLEALRVVSELRAAEAEKAAEQRRAAEREKG